MMEKKTRSGDGKNPLEMSGNQNPNKKDDPSYPPVIVHLGLCLTCNHSLTCTYTRSSDSPVLFCEEFDISQSSNSPIYNPAEVQAAKHIQSSNDRLPGLCSNCENRRSCTFPKAEGGIWHCEEYI